MITVRSLAENHDCIGQERERQHCLQTQSLVRSALIEAPSLETLILDCRLDFSMLLSMVETARPPALKRLRIVRPADTRVLYELRNTFDSRSSALDPEPDYEWITSREFERLLRALPALECLDLRGYGWPLTQLSFGMSGMGQQWRLRQLVLPRSWQAWPRITRTFPTGRQLRDIISSFPLLERLSQLEIQTNTIGSDRELTQADLDFFCANTTRPVTSFLNGRSNWGIAFQIEAP